MKPSILDRLFAVFLRRPLPSDPDPGAPPPAPGLAPLSLRSAPYQMFVIPLTTGGFRAMVALDGKLLVYEDTASLFQAVMTGLYLLSVFTGISAGKLYREWIRRHGGICPQADAPPAPPKRPPP